MREYESLSELVDDLEHDCKALSAIEDMDDMLSEFFKVDKVALAKYFQQHLENGWPDFAKDMVGFVSYSEPVFYPEGRKLWYHLTYQDYVEIIEQDVS